MRASESSVRPASSRRANSRRASFVGHQELRLGPVGLRELADPAVDGQELGGDGFEGSHEVGPREGRQCFGQSLGLAHRLRVGISRQTVADHGGDAGVFGPGFEHSEDLHLPTVVRVVRTGPDASEEDLARDLALVGLDPESGQIVRIVQFAHPRSTLGHPGQSVTWESNA